MVAIGISIGYLFVRFAECQSGKIEKYFNSKTTLITLFAIFMAWYFAITGGFLGAQYLALDSTKVPVKVNYGLVDLSFLNLSIYLSIRTFLRKKELELSEVWEKPNVYLILTLSVATMFYILNAMFCWGCAPVKVFQQKVHYMTLDGVNFDLPVEDVYVPRKYQNRSDRKWKVWEGNSPNNRKTGGASFLRLLPEFEAKTNVNANEFNVLGHGNIVKITMTRRKNINLVILFL